MTPGGGMLAYEALTGEGPYRAASKREAVAAHLMGQPRPISQLRAGISSDLEGLLLRCLARDPAHRPRAQDIASRLSAVPGGVATGGSSAPTAEAGDGLGLMRRRIPQIVTLTAAGGAGLLGLVIGLIQIGQLPSSAAPFTINLVAWGLAASGVLGWYHGFGVVSPYASLLASNTAFGKATGLPVDGAEIITASATLESAKKIAPFAEKHRMVVAMHNHSNTSDPNEFASPESFGAALKLSKYFKVNLDIGHFTAAKFDALAFLDEHHDRIVSMHLKDRKRTGETLPFGLGDAPVAAVLPHSDEMMALARRLEEIFHDVFRPDGINIGMNLGRSAGAGIDDHIHLHVVPRWNGDTNFMTAVGQTRVLSEEPAAACTRLRPYFA